jgi:hypothetical protein
MIIVVYLRFARFKNSMPAHSGFELFTLLLFRLFVFHAVVETAFSTCLFSISKIGHLMCKNDMGFELDFFDGGGRGLHGHRQVTLGGGILW